MIASLFSEYFFKRILIFFSFVDLPPYPQSTDPLSKFVFDSTSRIMYQILFLLRLANPAYGLALSQNFSALFEHVGIEDIKG